MAGLRREPPPPLAPHMTSAPADSRGPKKSAPRRRFPMRALIMAGSLMMLLATPFLIAQTQTRSACVTFECNWE